MLRSNFFLAFIICSVNAIAQSPGNISSDLRLWLKADIDVYENAAGTDTAEVDDGVEVWGDQSGGSRDVADAGSTPVLKAADAAHNFNRYIEFTDDRFTRATIMSGTNSDGTVFVVANATALGGYNTLVGFDTDQTGDEPQFATNGTDMITYIGSSTPNEISGSTVTTNINNLYTWDWVDGNGGGNQMRFNASSTSMATMDFSTEARVVIGGDNAGESWDGDISEVIVYDAQLSSANIRKVESYLAIKYGITLDNGTDPNGDYTSSGGTTIWDASVNATYHNDVAGIGRDDSSALDQQKSISNNADAMVIMDKGSAFGSDEDFILWGNDNGAITKTTVGSHSSYANKLSRTWKAATNGTPGNVTVQIVYSNDGTAANYALLVDTDSDFSNGGTTTYTPASFSGDTMTFTNVSISDGNFFTLATNDASPGSIPENLRLWLKAGVGVYENAGGTDTAEVNDGVEVWGDQSGGSRDVADAGSTPLLRSANAAHNYNRYIEFSNDHFTRAAVMSGANSDGTVFVVANATALGGYNTLVGFDTDQTGDEPQFATNGTDMITYIGGSTPNEVSGSTVATNANNLYAWDWVNGNGGGNQMRFNAGSTSMATMDFSTRQWMVIGGDNAGESWDGDISEVIVYDAQLSSANIRKVESYLALKYGITLDNGTDPNGDYTSSGGTTIWDASVNATYHNDIIGIGRDDNSALYQKQSRSQGDSLIVFLDALASDNASNTGTIGSDGSFIVIGHNQGRLQGQTGEKPAGVVTRLTREWKITNTNFNDDFNIELEWDSSGGFSDSHIRLLVDDDGDFSDATVYGTADGLTFGTGSIIVGGIDTAHIPANTTRYFTIASVNSGTPLPVELLSFEASVNEDQVDLMWVTASETNNAFFTVERSKNGISWEKIAVVEGEGNSNNTVEYFETDYEPLWGISYYRLKQTDYDGRHEYSQVRTVNIDVFNNPDIDVYPNPADIEITIEGSAEELRDVRIYTLTGQDVTNLTGMKHEGKKLVTMDIANLSSGIYVVKTKTTATKLCK